MGVNCKESSTEQISLQHRTTLNVNRKQIGNACEAKNQLSDSRQNDNINNSQRNFNLKINTIDHFIETGSACLTTQNESLITINGSQNQIRNDNHSTDEDFNDNSNDTNAWPETLDHFIRNTDDALEINNSAVTDVVTSATKQSISNSAVNDIVTSATIESVNKSIKKINANLKTNHKVYPYCCDLCKKRFNRPGKLKLHKKSKCGMIKMLSCNICNKGYIDKRYLTEHIKVVHRKEDKSYRCEQCNCLFKVKSSLRKHIRTKHEQNDSLPQTCQYCQKTYTSIKSLNDHIRFQHRHIGWGNFECAHCSRIFKRKECLISHIKRTHVPDQIKCNICNKPLSSHDSLKKHMQNQHTEESKLVCDICGKCFKDKYRLANHLRIHTDEKSFVCQTCGKCFRTKSKLTQHSVTHSRRRPFEFDNFNTDGSQNQISNDNNSIDDDFNDNSNDTNGRSETLQAILKRNTANALELNNSVVTDIVTSAAIESVNKSFQNINVNLNSNQGFYPYCCDLCNKPFDRPSKLKLHKESKCGMIKMFFCNICAKGFIGEMYLEQHIKVVHTQDKSYKCEQCNCLFKAKSSLRKHIRTKHEQNDNLPQTCQYCQKTYTSITSLKHHIRFQHRRIGWGNFECAHCSRIFKRKNSLISHIKHSHIADQIKCNICNNPLSSLENLKKHMQSQHIEEIKLVCDFCGKLCKDKYRLANHLRTHTDEKPFVCQTCGKCFRTDANLTQHSVIHSGRRPFECSKCSMSFRIKNHLRQHMAVHGMTNTSMARRK